MALGLLVIALGAIWRLVIAFNPVPVCSTPGSREGPSSHVTIVYALIAGLCNALNVTAQHGADHDVLSEPRASQLGVIILARVIYDRRGVTVNALKWAVWYRRPRRTDGARQGWSLSG